MKRIAVIVNPRSGRGRGAAILERVRPILNEAAIEVVAWPLDSPGAKGGPDPATADLSGLDALCAIGGDGTFHHVLNAMLTREDGQLLPLGLIPGGTGNALAHDLHRTDPLEAARRLARFRPQPLDLMKVECPGFHGYAFNLAAFGIMVSANRKAERWRVLKGKRYDAAALWEILFHRHYPATLTIDDGDPVTDDYSLIAGLNTMHTGLGMRAAPHAELADGRLDLIVIRRARRRHLIGMLKNIYRGTHVDDPRCEYLQAASFTIAADPPSPLNIDGETRGATPVSVTLQPGRVQLL